MTNKEILKITAEKIQHALKSKNFFPLIEGRQFELSAEPNCVRIALIGRSEAPVRGFGYQNGSSGLTPPNYAGVRSSEEVRFMRELMGEYTKVHPVEHKTLNALSGWELAADIYVRLHNFTWRLNAEKQLVRLVAPDEKGWVNWNMPPQDPVVDDPENYRKYIDWYRVISNIEDPFYTMSLPPIHQDIGAAWQYLKGPLEEKGWVVERIVDRYIPKWQVKRPGSPDKVYAAHVWEKDEDALALTKAAREALIAEQKKEELNG